MQRYTLLPIHLERSTKMIRYFLILILGSFSLIYIFLIQHSPTSTNDRCGDSLFRRYVVSKMRPLYKNNEYIAIQRGEFWALFNYIRANKQFSFDESVTYTTVSDVSFLDNLEPLIERWRGPLSIAVYTPSNDFHRALRVINYLRCCGAAAIFEYVSFHLYFESEHMPINIPSPSEYLAYKCSRQDCSLERQIVFNFSMQSSYRFANRLSFPINVGRNIARDGATTRYILASDIELYPNVNLIDQFLDMIRKFNVSLQNDKREVYVVTPFEVVENAKVPTNKWELVEMLNNRTARPFHKGICASCHRVAGMKGWTKAEIRNDLGISHTIKKRGIWEPFYIGTNREPYFDERLSWEGRLNKLTQAYSMCLLDYDYHVLDNAFLVHKPGIKTFHLDPNKRVFRQKNLWYVRHKITSELHALYGVRNSCSSTPWY